MITAVTEARPELDDQRSNQVLRHEFAWQHSCISYYFSLQKVRKAQRKMILRRGREAPIKPIEVTPPPEGPGAFLLTIETPSLGVDGGGLRGAFAAMLLEMIERAINNHKKEHQPVGAYFQLLSGTSTGSIIAGAAAAGMCAHTISDFYQNEGRKIFRGKRQAFVPGRSLLGIKDGALYSSKPLEKLLAELLHNTRLDQLDYPLLATAYAMNSRGHRGPVIFHGGPGYSFPANIELREAIRASTAAPTFFAPAEIESNGSTHCLVDGGLSANNPTYLGFLELRRRMRLLHPNIASPRYVILSIGTGLDHSARDPAIVRKSARISWLNPKGKLFLVDQMMHAQSELVHHMLRMHDDVHHYRIDFDLPEDWVGMDDAIYLPDLRDMAKRIATGNCISKEEWLLSAQLNQFMHAFLRIQPVNLSGHVPPLY